MSFGCSNRRMFSALIPRSTNQSQHRSIHLLEPLLVGARLDEELDLHLLELAGAEDEVSRRDLVAEGLADLADAERRLLARGLQHVGEVGEDALGRLRAQVVQAGLVVDDAEEGLEQARELADLGPLADLVRVLRVGDVGESVHRRMAVLGLVRLEEVVGAVALVGDERLGERVAEHLDVPGCLPDGRRQDDGRVESDHVAAAAHEGVPPLALDVLFQLDAEGAVVPGRPGSAVDVTGGEDEPAVLRQRDYRIESRLFSQWCSQNVLCSGQTPRRTNPTEVVQAPAASAVCASGPRRSLPGRIAVRSALSRVHPGTDCAGARGARIGARERAGRARQRARYSLSSIA